MSWLDKAKSPNIDERLITRTMGTGVHTLHIDGNVSVKAVPQWLTLKDASFGIYKTEVHFEDSRRKVTVPASRPSIKQAIEAGVSYYRNELISTLVWLDQEHFSFS